MLRLILLYFPSSEGTVLKEANLNENSSAVEEFSTLKVNSSIQLGEGNKLFNSEIDSREGEVEARDDDKDDEYEEEDKEDDAEVNVVNNSINSLLIRHTYATVEGRFFLIASRKF